MSFPVKIYRYVKLPGTKIPEAGVKFIAKFRVFLKDRPGSLADLSSIIARNSGNISFFHYDRSVDASRVVLEVQFKNRDDIETLTESLAKRKNFFAGPKIDRDGVQIVTLENVLEIKVGLVNKLGSLATFSRLLKKHRANVIYMLYDEDIDAESADIAIATESADEVDNLLGVVNSKGYSYRVVYRGSEEEKFGHIIGLKQVEKFFLRLKELVADSDINEVRSLVDSSQELYCDLVRFYDEAGNDLEAGDIFEKVLALASMAVSCTGERFSATRMLPLQLNDRVRLSGLRLPTTENIYLFEHDDQITMIDAGYGLYYEDIKSLLRSNSLEPARVKRIFVTHPDADHTGTAGYFEKEFGTRIFIHKGARAVMKSNNRGYGSSGRLENLNKYFTRLVTRFTRCSYPTKASYFSDKKIGTIGSFRVIDRFLVGDIEFRVLESKGGHIPGQVFFINQNYGLCFTSDFLINTKSLSSEDTKNLSIHRDLLTSVNSDSAVFREEMTSLQNLIANLDNKLKKQGRCTIIFPGHGNYYNVDSA